jgi:AcrR family transcriptional regulator
MAANATKGDKKRWAILESAIAIIAKEGLESLTFEAIGKRLKVRKSHVAYYFPDKKDIVYASVEYAAGAGVQVLQEHMRKHAGTLKSYVDGNFLWLEKYPAHAPVFLLFYYFASLDERYRMLYGTIRSVGQQRIKAMLVDEKPELPAAAIAALAIGIQNLITASLVEAYTTVGSPIEIKANLHEQVSRLIQSYLITGSHKVRKRPS